MDAESLFDILEVEGIPDSELNRKAEDIKLAFEKLKKSGRLESLPEEIQQYFRDVQDFLEEAQGGINLQELQGYHRLMKNKIKLAGRMNAEFSNYC